MLLSTLTADAPKCSDINNTNTSRNNSSVGFNSNYYQFDKDVISFLTKSTHKNIVDRALIGAYKKDTRFDSYSQTVKCRLVIAELTTLHTVENSNPVLLLECVAELNRFVSLVEVCPICSNH